MAPDDGTVVVPVGVATPGGGDPMPSQAEQAHEQNMAMMMQSGVVAQNNFITVQKTIDYDHMENKRMVTLDEAVGVREVASQTTPGGPRPAGT